jgi:putative membrane protein
MKRLGFLSLVLISALAVGCNRNPESRASNAPGGAVGTAGTTDVPRADKDFVHDVTIANMAELDLARLAADQSTNADVKKFAQMMIDDHTKAGDSLSAVATQHNIEMPTAIDDNHRDVHDKLAQKKGFEFDRDYISRMVDEHQDFVDKLESRIDKENLDKWKSSMGERPGGKTEVKGKAEAILPEKSDNPITASVNQWAADTYPVAFAHLQQAKDLDKQLKKRTTD